MTEQLRLGLDAPVPSPPLPPPDQRARDRIIAETATTLFVEAGAGAGKTTALVGRISRLVDEGVPIDAIAAITFTEKAAADLRHRLREELARTPSARRQAALDGLDHAPIGTLHAFARRILFEFPIEAGLPPGFTVLDELESQLALDERWDDLLDDVLDDADREIAPGLTAAELVQLIEFEKFGIKGLRRMAEDFQANWDLVEQRVALTAPPRPTLDVADVVDLADRITATPVPAHDTQATRLAGLAEARDALAHAEGIKARLDALVCVRDAASASVRAGAEAKWKHHGGRQALHALRGAAGELAQLAGEPVVQWREHRRLVGGAITARFVLAGARQRAAAGTLEFHDLLVLARRLLAHSDEARLALHQRYRRVLLDEFQDTDPIQLDIAVRLTADPVGQPSGDPAGLCPLPGRVFVVGDPKQSIYRFRRADIAVYLDAGERLGSTREVLSANFRSTDAVIDWVNGVFADVIRPHPEVQPEYRPLDACRPGPRHHGTVSVIGADLHAPAGDEKITARDLREWESADVAATIARALHDGWPVTDGAGGLRPCRPGDIAVLLPARTSLPMLEAALAELAVPYRAENASVVYLAPEIRHLMLALRAAADPTDELAVVAALRTPLYGCSDVDLFDWRDAGGRWNPFAPVPDACDDHPVADAMAHVRSIARRLGHAGPAELLDAIIEQRRVLETALAGPDARDVWRRVRFVVDQARAWTDAGGRGVRRYLRWAAHQAAEGRANDTILPERDHDAVRIMTVHAAKGLEFPITIVAGLTTQMRRTAAASVVWPDGTWTLTERDNVLFEAFRPFDEQMGDAERRRLLYVACTRATDHLVVSLHRKSERTDGDTGTAPCTSATVLAEAGAAAHGAIRLAPAAAPLVAATGDALELPWADPVEWAAARERAVEQASRRSATSATRLARDAPGAIAVPGADAASPPQPDTASRAPADPGLVKGAVDLDLPPWQRGRYGTAIGRAVHAVLQDADLATGHDVAALAVAQCAAEGIFGFEEQVADLCRSALQAPIVRAAAAGAEHWRELFVVAEVGGAVLEGYIDLLVRTPAGLVVVDHKTDQWRGGADAAERLGRYRLQLAAYGVALERILGEAVVGGVLVRCIPGRPAEEIPVPAWDDARATVEKLAGAAQSG